MTYLGGTMAMRPSPQRQVIIMNTTALFDRFELTAGMTLRNRIVMAPMTTWSSNPDATISNQEDAYYRARVKGVGLVISGCSHVTPNGIGFTDEFACYDDHFLPSLRRLAEAAKSGGAPAILQIFHAGNKAVPELVPDGDLVGASAGSAGASSFAKGQSQARALTTEEIASIVEDFGSATRRAIAAGFDGVELHGAHGFLLQNFLSPRSNRRTDEWGGALANRMRFPLAVIAEVRRVIDQEASRPFVLGYRISPEEPGEGGLRIEESFVLVDRLADAGVDYLHASLANLLEDRPIGAAHGQTIVELLLDRLGGSLPLLAAGQIRTPEQAVRARTLGLSLVAIGQGLVMDPDWVASAAGIRPEPVATVLDLADATPLAIPAKLATVIGDTRGWFALVPERQLRSAGA
jgi:2,4-dienoyl-CoA reductase-like NADH-dependent reductase (Old Yellow Enzyme family)